MLFEKFIPISFIFIFSFSFLFSQQIKLKSVELNKQNKTIAIPYEIIENGSYPLEYDIDLYYSSDLGQSYQLAEQVSGDVSEYIIVDTSYSSGGQKEIIWDFHEEDPNFNGQNTKFKLDVSYIPSVMGLGGKEWAWKSMYAPGLGYHKKVKRHESFKWRWVLPTVAFYGMVAGGIIYRLESNSFYNQYLESRTLEDAQVRLNSANDNQAISTTLFIGAGTIFITYFIRTYIKGRNNERRQKKIIEKNKVNTELQSYYTPNEGLNFGLRFSF